MHSTPPRVPALDGIMRFETSARCDTDLHLKRPRALQPAVGTLVVVVAGVVFACHERVRRRNGGFFIGSEGHRIEGDWIRHELVAGASQSYLEVPGGRRQHGSCGNPPRKRRRGNRGVWFHDCHGGIILGEVHGTLRHGVIVGFFLERVERFLASMRPARFHPRRFILIRAPGTTDEYRTLSSRKYSRALGEPLQQTPQAESSTKPCQSPNEGG